MVKNNEIIGDYTQYRKSGELKFIIEYDDNKKKKTKRKYNKKGKLVKITHYLYPEDDNIE